MMEYAGFDSLDAARKWRADHGGWLFLSECCAVIWFSIKFTTTQSMTHRAIRGMSGRQI